MKIARDNARSYQRRVRVQDTKAVRTKRIQSNERAARKRAERDALELEEIFGRLSKGMWL